MRLCAVLQFPVALAQRKTAYLCFLLLFTQTTPVLLAQTVDETAGAVPAQIIADWEAQDKTGTSGYKAAITAITATLPDSFAQKIKAGHDSIASLVTTDAKWSQLYQRACHYRRIVRMKPYMDKIRKIVFTRHYTMGGLFQGFQEGLGDNRCKAYAGGSALCLLTFDTYYSTYKTLLEERTGVIKDPDVSFDGKKIVFAWTKDNQGFHLYETEAENPAAVRQITANPTGLTISDFDPCYLPNGDILFQSSRCFQLVDCYFNIVSNLYTCNSAGRHLRRIGFDQVQTFYPTMMDDGKVLYTRWEYNDRSQVYSMGLFTMFPDGSHQEALYGNQSWWPTSIIHGRKIPKTGKVLAVLSGHHTAYSGELAIFDPNRGREEASGVQLVAPVRKAAPVKQDNGGVQFRFQFPYPLDETTFLTGWRSNDSSPFALYFMNADGKRELLAWDKEKSINRPVPLAARPAPFQLASTVDYRDSTGVFTMQDIYEGPGLRGVARGTIKKLRVVALDYRVDKAIGFTFFRTNEFDLSAHTYTPIARSSGSWDVKKILGETPVYEDGSAAFTVPARTPVYFQAIDSNGQVVQTMRSWSTLQPNETFSCYGCHEDKISAPPHSGVPLAGAPKPLEKFYGIESQGFSYTKIIQPIWDRHCISCHNQSHTSLDLRGNTIAASSLTGSWLTPWADRDNAAKKSWNQSYCKLTEEQGKYVSWIITQSYPSPLAPYPPGSSNSPLVTRLRKGHKEVVLSKEEFALICAWIDLCIPHSGDYTEGMAAADKSAYTTALKRREQWETIEKTNIKEYIAATPAIAGKKTHPSTPPLKPPRRFGIQLTGEKGRLVIEAPHGGILRLLDPAGREVFAVPVTGSASSLQLIFGNIAPGIYVAVFTGMGNRYSALVPMATGSRR